MIIKRIKKIKNYRVFHDFTWCSDLPEFKNYNLFYGWNGTGKTTLSTLFRELEVKRHSVVGGVYEIETANGKIQNNDIVSLQTLPSVKVFNRDFVAENIFTSTGEVSPIYFLGKENIEKQKKTEALRIEESSKKGDLSKKIEEKKQAENALDSFSIEKAKSIKELLSSSGQNPYNNYDKAKYKQKVASLKAGDWQKFKQSDEQKDKLKKQKEASNKPKNNQVSFNFENISTLSEKVKSILHKTVLSQVVDRLKDDPPISQWVGEGLKMHKERSSAVCLFCEKPLPEGHLQKLEGHFNDEYSSFISQIETTIQSIEGYINAANGVQLPDKAILYDHLCNEYDTACSSFNDEVGKYVTALTELKNELTEKQKKPFVRLSLKSNPSSFDAETLNSINKILNKHNAETDNFQKTVKTAREQLEAAFVAESLEDYIQKEKQVENFNSEVNRLNTDVSSLSQQIATLEREIIEHRLPADELNKDLAAYLGRNEIQLTVKDTGYQITQNGDVADALSEGEKTAIAFLYFLKSLNDKNFNLGKGIVVIDDPVSSLDSNAMFYAFGFMKERTSNAGQLFILTHNFAFFRQVKNWFNHVNKRKKKLKKESGFYMLECTCDQNGRNAGIMALDKLLMDYESEYHYLFSLVVQGADSTVNNCGLESRYHYPNIARRLLEAFLAFRKPKEAGELKQQMDALSFNVEKKTKILRFVHTHSHYGHIGDPEHDISVLSETPAVLHDLIELIKSEDPKHFDEMSGLVNNVNETEEIK